MLKLKKSNILYLAMITLIFFWMCFLHWGKTSSVLVDVAREFYIPAQILQGKLLFKDILSLYGPFSYQLNAVLYAIFGQNITTLQGAAAAAVFISVIMTYFIARTMATGFTSFMTVLVILFSAVFSQSYWSGSSYFTPYSYALLYSFTAFLAEFCLFIYLTVQVRSLKAKPDKRWKFCFYGSILCAGILACFKLPFITQILLYSFIAYTLVLYLFSYMSVRTVHSSKSKNNKLMMLCFYGVFLCGGAAVCSKIDFLPHTSILLLSLLFDKRFTQKQKFTGLALSASLFVLCWGALFLQGLTISDIVNYINFYRNFSASSSVEQYTVLYQSLAWNWSLDDLKDCFGMFIKMSFLYAKVLAISAALLLPFRLTKKMPAETRIPVWIGIALSYIYPYTKFLRHYIEDNAAVTFFSFSLGTKNYSWLSYLVIIIFIIILAEYIKKPSKKMKIFLLVTSMALMGAYRVFWNIHSSNTGLYTLHMYFIPVVIYFMEYFPRYFGKRGKDVKVLIVVFLAIMALIHLAVLNGTMKHYYNYTIKNLRGTLRVHSDTGKLIDAAADFVRANLKPGETVLMLPEGPLLPLMLGVETSPKYYSLIPNVVEAYGEENVVSALKQLKFDYILVTNESYIGSNGYGVSGEDYNLQIQQYINSNYRLVETFEQGRNEYPQEAGKKDKEDYPNLLWFPCRRNIIYAYIKNN